MFTGGKWKKGWSEIYLPPKLPPAEQAKLARAYRVAIVELYQEHDPTKVGKVDEIMRKYEGGEWHLYKTICQKYNTDYAPLLEAPMAAQLKRERAHSRSGASCRGGDRCCPAARPRRGYRHYISQPNLGA